MVMDSRQVVHRFTLPAQHSKLNTRAAFIKALRDQGRKRADACLDNNLRHVGVRSSFTFDEHVF
jgi:hypothetical protein